MVDSTKEFPQISLNQLEGLFEEMATLYRHYGYGMRAVYYCRFVVALNNGDRATATQWLSRFQSEPRYAMANCEACEADDLVKYYELMDDFEKAIEIAQPSFDGQRRCTEVPHRTLNYVLRPLAILGRYEEADRCQRRGYRLIRKFLVPPPRWVANGLPGPSWADGGGNQHVRPAPGLGSTHLKSAADTTSSSRLSAC